MDANICIIGNTLGNNVSAKLDFKWGYGLVKGAKTREG